MNTIQSKIKQSKYGLKESICHLEKCKYSSKMQINLINDMMDLAKTE